MDESDNTYNLTCLRCGKAMEKAQLITYLACQPVVRIERKGVLSAPVQLGTECYVCTECGYI